MPFVGPHFNIHRAPKLESCSADCQPMHTPDKHFKPPYLCLGGLQVWLAKTNRAEIT